MFINALFADACLPISNTYLWNNMGDPLVVNGSWRDKAIT
jgi:hypothetical protein